MFLRFPLLATEVTVPFSLHRNPALKMLWSHRCTMDPEELELQNDYRYRNYAAVIEKALRNFESSSEWADLISSLGKLVKVCNDGPNGIKSSTTAFAIWCLCCHRLTHVLPICAVKLSYFSLGSPEQSPLLPSAQEADYWEASCPVPAPSSAKRRAPQGSRDLWGHF